MARSGPGSASGAAGQLRFGWVGFHVEGVPALRALLANSHPPAAVITLEEEALARRSGHVSYEELLAESQTPLYRVRNINDPEAVALLRSLDLDVVFVIGWSQIVHPEALGTARLGMIGAHASLLPHNRGSAPINWALIRGESSTGNSLMWLSPHVDEGELIDQIEFPITPYDTCDTLYAKVADTNREMILRLLPRLSAGERPGRPQPTTDEPLLPRRRPTDGAVDWSRSAREVYDFLRALTRPYPGAFSYLDGEKYLLWTSACLPASCSPGGAPGEVLGPVYSPVPEACGQLVACGSGAVILLDVQQENGPVLSGPALGNCDWTGKRWRNG